MFKRLSPTALVITASCLLAAPGVCHAQFGAVLSGAGPVNRSMAGASTAAPLSPGGALYWNAATLSGLERSELETGAELFWAHTKLESRVPANGFGPGVPPVGLGGSTRGNVGPFALPTIALAYKPDDSLFTYGLGIFAAAGLGTDYPGSNLNPILTAPPPNGLGFGPIYADYQVLQIAPAVSYRVTDRLSIGGGINLNLQSLRLSPGVFAAPDNANGDPFATYPSATHPRSAWGLGFNLGAYYDADEWAFGASFRSPQWFQTMRYYSADELGRPRELRFALDLPSITSVGVAYKGIDRWLFAADLRYLDYENATGFGDQGFDATGALRGLGLRSIFAAAFGVQYKPVDPVSLRVGYSWNQNPITSRSAFVNVASPVVVQHMAYAGASVDITRDLTLSVAYMHAFEGSAQGPFVLPSGPVPGTSLRSSTSADSIMFGLSVKFGGGDCGSACREPEVIIKPHQ